MPKISIHLVNITTLTLPTTIMRLPALLAPSLALTPTLDYLRSEGTIQWAPSILGGGKSISATVHDFGCKGCDGPCHTTFKGEPERGEGLLYDT
jgi:hypothetical protein